MEPFISEYYPACEILTPNDGAHYFFAYYDMRATGKDGRHLCHRVRFWNRLPTSEDVCEVGYLENGAFFKIGETTAWNFQQGAMLQYHPTRKDTVYYNVCENGHFLTVTHNFVTGEKKYADRAVACVSPDGRFGLAVNFGRIYDFRPGYGYAGFCDANANVNAPEDDGVFLVDMESGTSRLLCSYRDLAPLSGFDTSVAKLLVNHITFNTTSDRYVMLVRNFRTEEAPWWLTSMMIGDLSGNVKNVLPKTYVSHYFWTGADRILAHCTVEGERKGMYEINVDSGEWTEYDMPYFHGDYNTDIHCNRSPDGSVIIGDGYPIEGYRYLMAYSLRTGKSRELLRVKTETPNGIVDIRCDLHARFVWDGSHISFDTVHNGRREIALIPANQLDF